MDEHTESINVTIHATLDRTIHFDIVPNVNGNWCIHLGEVAMFLKSEQVEDLYNVLRVHLLEQAAELTQL